MLYASIKSFNSKHVENLTVASTIFFSILLYLSLSILWENMYIAAVSLHKIDRTTITKDHVIKYRTDIWSVRWNPNYDFVHTAAESLVLGEKSDKKNKLSSRLVLKIFTDHDCNFWTVDHFNRIFLVVLPKTRNIYNKNFIRSMYRCSYIAANFRTTSEIKKVDLDRYLLYYFQYYVST